MTCAGAPPSCLTSNGRSKQLHGYCCLSVSQFFSPTFFPPTPCLSVVSGAPPSCSKQMHGYCCLSVVADLVHRDFMSSALNSKCYIALVTCVEHLNGLCILCALQCLFKVTNCKNEFLKRIQVLNLAGKMLHEMSNHISSVL